MSEIIKESWVEHFEEYSYCYHWVDDPHSGFSFPCDKQGNIDRTKLHPCAIENLDMCLNNPDKLVDDGVVDYSRDYRHAPTLHCDCGCEFELQGGGVMGEIGCFECGQVYNIFGQKLDGYTQPWVGMNEYGEYYSEEDY